jgi:AGCS family alanine or glycine:cation symporter
MHDIFNFFFEYLFAIDQFFWTYIGFSILLASGLYLTFKTKFFQFKVLLHCRKCFAEILKGARSSRGIHPIRLYFTSVSGMVGLGNIVGIITAIAIGGPGALFWMWVAVFPSMLVKYSEIYLGIRYRVPNNEGGYDGGPMFYLKKAFKNHKIPLIASALLCVYGVEVFQFDVVIDVMSATFNLNRFLAIFLLLSLVLYTVLGGMNRLSRVCTFLMPIFIVTYIGMCVYIIGHHSTERPGILRLVLKSAFSGQAATGGFAGSSAIMAMQQGFSKAVYSGDIGIGYDSIINAETKAVLPQQQARLVVFSLLTDSIICSLSIGVVLVTNVWMIKLSPGKYVAHALSLHFANADIFMGIFLLIAGFTTIVAYLSVGLKSAFFMGGKKWRAVYLAYAIFAFIFFSFFDQEKVILIMSVSAGALIVFNILGILRLQKFIKFQ